MATGWGGTIAHTGSPGWRYGVVVGREARCDSLRIAMVIVPISHQVQIRPQNKLLTASSLSFRS